ncbi:MAG TPA: hypothetical protein V6D00_10055 [Pantanalinema sp.]
MSTFRKHAILLVVGTLAFSMATGCGRTPTGVDDGTGTNTGDDTSIYDPGTGGGSTYNPGTGTGTGTGTGSGIYNPGTGTGGYPAASQVIATPGNKQMVAGGFLWLSKKIKTATITVQNPGTTAASGKLTVSLSWKGEQKETQEIPFNVAAGQTTTVNLTPKETVDDFTVSVIADQNAGTGYGNGTGTGTGNGYY